MTVPIVAFFNNRSGVGQTSLVYHMAWMNADLGRTVVAVDLDPQANLTAAFLDEERIEALWRGGGDHGTIYDAMSALARGVRDLQTPVRETISTRLHLIASHLAVSGCEDELAREWPICLNGSARALRVTTAFWRCIQRVAEEVSADVALVDLGPELGAINRAALIASDYLVVPVAPDLFSFQGLRNLGPFLRVWRAEWADRVARNPEKKLTLPAGTMNPVGYVVLEPIIRLERPAGAVDRWMARIPSVYSEAVLGRPAVASHPEADPQCLGMVKRYGSLMPLSQAARKPVFHLGAGDGAVGAPDEAAGDTRRDFEALAHRIAAASWQRAE